MLDENEAAADQESSATTINQAARAVAGRQTTSRRSATADN